jgi:hypothetical protein
VGKEKTEASLESRQKAKSKRPTRALRENMQDKKERKRTKSRHRPLIRFRQDLPACQMKNAEGSSSQTGLAGCLDRSRSWCSITRPEKATGNGEWDIEQETEK